MATNYQHGILGSATANGTAICLTSWDLDHVIDFADTTTVCTGAWKTQIPGLKQVTGSISGDFDLNNPPFSGQNLTPGTLITTLKLIISASNYYTMSAWITSFKFTDEINDVFKWTATFVSDGAVTYTGF